MVGTKKGCIFALSIKEKNNIKNIMKTTLEDLKRELWFRRRNSGKLSWTTKNGVEIDIRELSDEHLINIITMLDEQSANKSGNELIDEFDGYRRQLYSTTSIND